MGISESNQKEYEQFDHPKLSLTPKLASGLSYSFYLKSAREKLQITNKLFSFISLSLSQKFYLYQSGAPIRV